MHSVTGMRLSTVATKKLLRRVRVVVRADSALTRSAARCNDDPAGAAAAGFSGLPCALLAVLVGTLSAPTPRRVPRPNMAVGTVGAALTAGATTKCTGKNTAARRSTTWCNACMTGMSSAGLKPFRTSRMMDEKRRPLVAGEAGRVDEAGRGRCQYSTCVANATVCLPHARYLKTVCRRSAKRVFSRGKVMARSDGGSGGRRFDDTFPAALPGGTASGGGSSSSGVSRCSRTFSRVLIGSR